MLTMTTMNIKSRVLYFFSSITYFFSKANAILAIAFPTTSAPGTGLCSSAVFNTVFNARLNVLFNIVPCFLLSFLLIGCQDSAHLDHEPEPIVFTHYTAETELFVEFSPLVVGQPSRLLVHLTQLKDFTPISQGLVDVLLQKNGITVARFEVKEPKRSGLFTPEVTARDAGEFEMVITLASSDLSSTHNLGKVTVFPSADAIDHHPEASQGDIVYLKEQQWQGTFATSLVELQPLRPTVPGFAQVIVPADGGADIPAPSDGYFASVDLHRLADSKFYGDSASAGDSVAAGDQVAAGDLLGYLVPRLGEGLDIGDSLVALERARGQLQLGKQDVERLDDLFKQGAIPERRLQEARQHYQLAQAEWRAAQARIEQLQTGTGNSGIALKAPMAGEVIEMRVQPGSFVRAGERIFRIATPARRWLQVQVPEHFAAQLHSASGIWFDKVGQGTEVIDAASGAKLVQVSSAIDPLTRTASVTFEYPTAAGPAAIGSRFAVNLYSRASEERPAVPRNAIVDDGGQAVVYVQTGGETFARREVTLGLIDANFVEIAKGVVSGERVVSEGAYSLRLAAASSEDLGHGHAH